MESCGLEDNKTRPLYIINGLCLLRISRELSLIIFPLVVSCSRVPFSVRTFHKATV